MRITLLALGIFLFLFSCQNNQKEASDELLKDIELEEDDMDDDIVISVPNGNFLSFSFRCTDNCGNKGVAIDTINKYKMRKPFRILKEETDSKLQIEFSFIDDCCIRHKAIANLENRILNLTFVNISPEVCECWCDYRFLFSTRKIAAFDTIKVNGIVIE